MTDWLFSAVSLIWTYLVPLMIFSIGIWLHYKTKGLVLRHLFKGIAIMWNHRHLSTNDGLSPLSALNLALSSTVGIGNIIGVFSAIQIGGPGALFWMWVLSIVCMPLKYSETLLALLYKTRRKTKTALGPLAYLEHLPMGKAVAMLFSVFTIISILFGIGTIPQVHMVIEVFTGNFDTPLVITAFVLTATITYITLGGLKSASRIGDIVMPMIIVTFCLGGIVTLALSLDKLPGAFVLVFQSAFGIDAIAGAGAGYAVRLAVENGVKRGVFSNESGLGSACYAAGHAIGVKPVEQGLIHLIEVFIDTLVINSFTGLIVIVSGVYQMPGDTMSLIELGFTDFLGVGRMVLVLSLIFFAFTTIVAWSYYGSACAAYVAGHRGVLAFRSAFIIIFFLSAFMSMELIWKITDFTLLLMLIPNLVAIWYFRKEVVQETLAYFAADKQVKK